MSHARSLRMPLRLFIPRLSTLMLVAAAFLPTPIPAQIATNTGAQVILDTSGFWRLHLTLRTPVIRNVQTLETVGAACDTLAPDQNWVSPGFDDSGWVRASALSSGQ
ncbi:MAG: hypothetical protein ACLQM8_12270 [Limisphaerales bacterium]